MTLKVKLQCKKHRQYTAKRAPSAECDTCWAIWDVSPDNGVGVKPFNMKRTRIKEAK